MSSGTAFLTAPGLAKGYLMGEVVVQALREIDLEIYAGEPVALLGPSGRGKSSLLNILGDSTPRRGVLQSARLVLEATVWIIRELGTTTLLTQI